MAKGIRIQDRDREILKEIINFNGLPASVIIKNHFKTKKYGYARLKLLEKNGYVSNTYYYAQNKKNGKKFAQRISAIYYATSLGCREVDCPTDYRYVVPNEDKLDVTNLVGNLYSRIPNLLSKRQAMEEYGLKGFMPVTCAIPNENPIFIYILGNKLGRNEIGATKNFIESYPAPATHYIISRDFKDRLNIQKANFVLWRLALEYLPNLAKDENYYLNEFLKIIQRELLGIRLLNNTQPLLRVQYGNQVLHLGELISGSNHLRFILQEPPENTIIYSPSRVHFYKIKLKSEKDSFIFYSQKDKGFFRMFLSEKNRMHSVKHKLRMWRNILEKKNT